MLRLTTGIIDTGICQSQEVEDQRSSQGIYMRRAGAAVVLSHQVEVQEDPTFGQQLP